MSVKVMIPPLIPRRSFAVIAIILVIVMILFPMIL